MGGLSDMGAAGGIGAAEGNAQQNAENQTPAKVAPRTSVGGFLSGWQAGAYLAR